LAVPWAEDDPGDLRQVDGYARVYSVDRAALVYPAASAARCLIRDLVNDGGAITLSICHLALFEDGGGELDRILASLIAQRALAAPIIAPGSGRPNPSKHSA
jgi:hypothetical protein